MKAKKNPTHHTTTDTQYIHALILRKRVQALACAGSIGQGALRAFQRMIPAARINRPDIPNVQTLYFDSATNHGAVLTSPASAAPAPSVTSNAGSAQHSNVPTEVNRLSVGSSVCFAL